MIELSQHKNAEYIASLIVKYKNDTLTAEEAAALQTWVAAAEENGIKLQVWSNEELLWHQLAEFSKFDDEKGWNKFKEYQLTASKKQQTIQIKRWWYAAASIALIIGLGVWSYQYFNKTKTPVSIAKATNDVTAPTANRAMITLADGRTVFLDSLNSGAVAQQGNIQVVKLDNGQIAYKTGSGEIVKEIQYNTLSNPRGSKEIDMTLADGTRVWLNAGSSITFPVAFVGDKRTVTLKGEGYFEVAKDAAKPFHVNAGAMDVQVLGTHFNVSAYSDEKDIKTTLLEGQVKVSLGKETTVLKPGQQAQAVTAEGKLTKTNGVDMDEVMAWKNGLFQFNNTDIQNIMRELARWYDIDVVYPKGIPSDKYWGSIRKDQNLSEVLKVLQESGAHFKVSGNKIEVLPN